MKYTIRELEYEMTGEVLKHLIRLAIDNGEVVKYDLDLNHFSNCYELTFSLNCISIKATEDYLKIIFDNGEAIIIPEMCFLDITIG